MPKAGHLSGGLSFHLRIYIIRSPWAMGWNPESNGSSLFLYLSPILCFLYFNNFLYALCGQHEDIACPISSIQGQKREVSLFITLHALNSRLAWRTEPVHTVKLMRIVGFYPIFLAILWVFAAAFRPPPVTELPHVFLLFSDLRRINCYIHHRPRCTFIT